MIIINKCSLFSIIINFFIILIIFQNISFAQEEHIKKGEEITIELFNSRILNGEFVDMDSVSIIYIPSGKTLFFKPKENKVEIGKIRRIYDKKGWVIYTTPKKLINYDYPTHEAFLGFSTISVRSVRYYSYTRRYLITELKKGISISGGRTIKKWMGLEARLNVFKEAEDFFQIFLHFNGYNKKHRYFGGFGIGGMGLIIPYPVYILGGGAKIYMFKDLALRIGVYDYYVPEYAKNNQHKIITELGLTIAQW
jgi:hypothetical protein